MPFDGGKGGKSGATFHKTECGRYLVKQARRP